MLRSVVGTGGVLVMLWTSLAQAAPCAGFTDVDTSSPFCVNVAWMKNRGITLGLTATQYAPNDPVTRLQMAAFLYRLGFQNTFLQGGNAFGAIARLGTMDDEVLEFVVNGVSGMRIQPDATSPSVLGGYVNNSTYAGVQGVHIGVGGAPSNSYAGVGCPYAFGCQNSATDHFGTIGGGVGNLVGDGHRSAVEAERAWLATMGVVL